MALSVYIGRSRKLRSAVLSWRSRRQICRAFRKGTALAKADEGPRTTWMSLLRQSKASENLKRWSASAFESKGELVKTLKREGYSGFCRHDGL